MKQNLGIVGGHFFAGSLTLYTVGATVPVPIGAQQLIAEIYSLGGGFGGSGNGGGGYSKVTVPCSQLGQSVTLDFSTAQGGTCLVSQYSGGTICSAVNGNASSYGYGNVGDIEYSGGIGDISSGGGCAGPDGNGGHAASGVPGAGNGGYAGAGGYFTLPGNNYGGGAGSSSGSAYGGLALIVLTWH
jgi:hypothetical protein